MSTSFECRDPALCASLHERGFCILEGLAGDLSDWDAAFACPLINYERIAARVQACARELDRRLGWRCSISKVRASAACQKEMSNASDAAMLHRDIACYRGVQHPPPIFTLVVYLDATKMQVVPGSHKRLRMSAMEGWNVRGTPQDVNAGDAVLFYASLLHGGMAFVSDQRDRRVIQCFAVYPDEASRKVWNPRVLHLPATEDDSKLSKTSARIMSRDNLMTRTLARLHQKHAAEGYPMHAGEALPPDVSVLCGEAVRLRTKIVDRFSAGNMWVVLDDAIRSADATTNARVRRAFYGAMRRNMKKNVAYLFLVCFALLYVARRLRRRT